MDVAQTKSAFGRFLLGAVLGLLIGVQAVTLNESGQEIDARADMLQWQVFIRLMGLVDEAWSHDNRLHTQLIEKRRLGAESYRTGGLAAERFATPGHVVFCRRFEGG